MTLLSDYSKYYVENWVETKNSVYANGQGYVENWVETKNSVYANGQGYVIDRYYKLLNINGRRIALINEEHHADGEVIFYWEIFGIAVNDKEEYWGGAQTFEEAACDAKEALAYYGFILITEKQSVMV